MFLGGRSFFTSSFRIIEKLYAGFFLTWRRRLKKSRKILAALGVVRIDLLFLNPGNRLVPVEDQQDGENDGSEEADHCASNAGNDRT